MRPVTVSSIFVNVEKLAVETAPGWGPALLGARFSLAWPDSGDPGALSEYSLPLDYGGFDALLAHRTGFRITGHAARESGDLRRYIAGGRAAIAAVDSFYLPYRPAFGRVHSARTLIVRRLGTAGEVWVEDPWPPAFTGPVRPDVLEQARHSDVPLDPIREPVYAGSPIDGEWWSVDLLPIPERGSTEWASAILADVVDDAAALLRWRAFRTWLERRLSESAERRRASVRQASLLLRCELSTRVYLCSFLLKALRYGDHDVTASMVRDYYNALHHFEAARDVLTKSLTHSRAEYGPYILTRLDAGIDADLRLAAILGWFASHPRAEALRTL